jgi:integrase
VAFETYAEQWRAAQVHRATTVAQVETHLRRHVYPTFGGQPLGSIRPSEVQAWVRSLERDLAPSTIGVVYSFVAGVFRAAVRDRITLTPCADVRLPKPEPKRVEPLATERVEALIAAMPERYRALVVLAAGTGMRQGEAYPLMLEHSFERTASQLRGGVALGSGATGRPGRARSTRQPTATPRGWCRSTLPDRVDAPARPLTARGRTTRGTPHGHQASSHHPPRRA